jgi:hypothetical protein
MLTEFVEEGNLDIYWLVLDTSNAIMLRLIYEPNNYTPR